MMMKRRQIDKRLASKRQPQLALKRLTLFLGNAASNTLPFDKTNRFLIITAFLLFYVVYVVLCRRF